MIIIYDKTRDADRLAKHPGMTRAAHTVIEIDGDGYRFMKRTVGPGQVCNSASHYFPLDELPEDVHRTVAEWLGNMEGLDWPCS